jgi:hypothetical protein
LGINDGIRDDFNSSDVASYRSATRTIEKYEGVEVVISCGAESRIRVSVGSGNCSWDQGPSGIGVGVIAVPLVDGCTGTTGIGYGMCHCSTYAYTLKGGRLVSNRNKWGNLNFSWIRFYGKTSPRWEGKFYVVVKYA